ncbi:MFS transporter [Herbaspirillum sp. SJZ102]|uniref:MFS transporter n=1 Tax=unclassified Herbaspirillum TaxID=2624150 RepID=UPI001153B7F0|nr:MFS transporter [Herbaspirillum sp. SJZ102]TQK03912.1 putative MFS family arabinose efflux permease [Herbaspirillum sp. SJZ130]TQK08644.1 putative MFS family arabinose efflux permease [Herbaspirillum sp. SJZ106]TWC71915.1 putative MFS family arabinose efflux permease [Herbaspirillum sp. SJZ099]
MTTPPTSHPGQQSEHVKALSLPPAYAAGRYNPAVLAVCQGLFTCAISIDLTLTALTGWQLAPDKALATLPFALITVAGALVTWFAAFLIQRLGRRLSFALGAASCCVGGLVSVWSVWHGDFWTFCAGTALVGVFQAFAQYYRLAAADAVSDEFKSRAISTVLAGGVIAAIAGPALAAWSKDLFPSALFAGAYLVVAVMGALSVLVLLLLYRDAAPSQGSADAGAQAQAPARTLGRIARTPVFIASVANNVAGSMVMMFIMTAAPLAAVACHYRIDDGAAIIQWHLVGMYAPSFFAGRLIKRFGLGAVLMAGLALNLACAATAMASTSLPAFYAALLFLGIGWNFMFVGGTTLLARSYASSEQAKTQGFSELLRYAATALATLGAGPLLARFGWQTLNAAILPILLLSALATAYWMLAQRASQPRPA